MLGSSMGMGMVPELWPQGLDQEFDHTTLIGGKIWCGGMGIVNLKAELAVRYRDRCAFLSRCGENVFWQIGTDMGLVNL